MSVNFYITGFNGFLGNILSSIIVKRNRRVFDINVLSKEKLDISKSFELTNPFGEFVIIHTAGKAHFIPKTIEEEKLFFDVNFTGTKNLCNALNPYVCSLKGFVFISTVSVYGQVAGNNINEEFPLSANSPYGLSKIHAENYIVEWGREKNIPVLILRLPLVAGPNPPGNLGKMINGIRNGRYFSINEGRAKRSVVMAEDVASCIIDNVGRSGIYNLTDGYHPTFREIEVLIANQLSRKLPTAIPNAMAYILGYFGDIFPFFPVNSATIQKMSNDLSFSDIKAQVELNWRPRKFIDKFKI